MCSFDAGLHHLTVRRDVFSKLKKLSEYLITRKKMIRLHGDLVKQFSVKIGLKLTTLFGNAWGYSLHFDIWKHMELFISVRHFFIDPSLSCRRLSSGTSFLI